MPSFTEDAPTYSVACTLAVVLNQQLIGSSYVISCHQAARVLVYCQLQLVCWIRHHHHICAIVICLCHM